MSLLRAVAEQLPRFNDELLVNFPKKQIESAPVFIDKAFQKAVQLVGNAVEYLEYEVLSPPDRIRYEFNLDKSTPRKTRIAMAVSEMLLVRYKFRHDGKILYTHFYTPYLVDNNLVVNGKQYAIHKCIAEKVFSRVRTLPKQDGVVLRLIRVNIKFNRVLIYKLQDAYKNRITEEFIVTAGLHHKKQTGKPKAEKTIIHYMLCKFGFKGVLERFGLTTEDASFVTYPDDTDKLHTYFLAKQPSHDNNIHLKVKTEVLDNPNHRKFIANMLYVLEKFSIQSIDDLNDPSGSIYRVMLGIIIYPDSPLTKARSDADTHLDSVDLFLDEITQERYAAFDVQVNDIYDLLLYTFIHIDSLMVNLKVQNMYNKRIDLIDGLLVASYATEIFNKFYGTNQRKQLQALAVKDLLHMNPNVINRRAFNVKAGGVNIVSTGPQIYNDNWLLSCGLFKTHPAGSAANRFHPSMAVVESINAFSGEDLGVSGFLNPLCPIDSQGGIIKPEWAVDIEPITKYLPG